MAFDIQEQLQTIGKDDMKSYLTTELQAVIGDFSQTPSAPIMQFIEILSTASEDMRQVLMLIMNSISWRTASGRALDNRAWEWGIARRDQETDESLRSRISDYVASPNNDFAKLNRALMNNSDELLAVRYQTKADGTVTLVLQLKDDSLPPSTDLETLIASQLSLGVVLDGTVKKDVPIDKGRFKVPIAYTLATADDSYTLDLTLSPKIGAFEEKNLLERITNHFQNNVLFLANEQVTRGRIMEIVEGLVPQLHCDNVEFVLKSAPATKLPLLPPTLDKYYKFDKVTITLNP